MQCWRPALCFFAGGVCFVVPLSDRCTLRRPTSHMDCGNDTERRFFFHQRNNRCEPFGICSQIAEEYDNATDLNYFVNRADCEQACSLCKCTCMFLCNLQGCTFCSSCKFIEFVFYFCSCGMSRARTAARWNSCHWRITKPWWSTHLCLQWAICSGWISQ